MTEGQIYVSHPTFDSRNFVQILLYFPIWLRYSYNRTHKENMESWHSKKCEKYSWLCSSVKDNGWNVSFFTIEFGDRGDCADTVRSCLIKKVWVLQGTASLGGFAAFSNPSCIKLPCATTKYLSGKKKQLAYYTQTTFCYHFQTYNKGNTCYANSMLQALTALPYFWKLSPSQSPNITSLRERSGRLSNCCERTSIQNAFNQTFLKFFNFFLNLQTYLESKQRVKSQISLT